MSINTVNSNPSSRVREVQDKLEKSRYQDEAQGYGIAGGRDSSRLEITHREFLDIDLLTDVNAFHFYQIQELDRLDLLAFEFLGDSRLWWTIADLNPSVIVDSLILPVGAFIKIPEAHVVEGALR